MPHDGSKSQETKVIDLKRETDKSAMEAGDFKSPLLNWQNPEPGSQEGAPDGP